MRAVHYGYSDNANASGLGLEVLFLSRDGRFVNLLIGYTTPLIG